MLALVISPIVTAGLFVGFVFSNLNKEMDLVRLKSQIELAQVGADKFMTNIKKSEWLNDAIYREVLEANFTNGSALFNTQSDLIYFTVLDSKTREQRYSRKHPEYEFLSEKLFAQFLYGESQIVRAEGVTYLVVKGQDESRSLYYVLVSELQDQMVPFSEEDESEFFILTKSAVLRHPRKQAFRAEIDLPDFQLVTDRLKDLKNGSFEFESWILAFSRVSRSNLYVALATPKVANPAEREARLSLIVWSAVAMVSLALIIGIVLSRRLSFAVSILSTSVSRLGKGDFNTVIPFIGRDELGRLASSFNSMAKKLNELFLESEMKARLDKELETAKVVQDSILPQSEFDSSFYSISAFYRPATRIGGDWWNFRLDENSHSLDLIVADATGHGPAAALATSCAAATLESMNVIGETRIDRWAYALNRSLNRTFNGNMFMTAIFARLEVRELHYHIAAHESILIVKKTGEVNSIEMKKPCAHLGKDEMNKNFPIETESLNAGDKVILFSDGLFELVSPAGIKLSMNRFVRLVKRLNLHEKSSHSARNSLLRSLLLMIPDRRNQEDDLLLVVTEVKK